MAEQHRNRTGLARHRVLDRELRRLHRGDRLLRLHDLLRDAAERAPRVPAAVIAGRLLIRGVQRKARRVAEIGQEQHRRTGQKGFERADQPVAEHPRPLPDHHAGPPRQPAIDLGHHAGQRLLAHRDHAHLVLDLGETLDDAPGMAAGDAEHILDPGFRQDARDQHPRRDFLAQHPLDRHRHSPRCALSLPSPEPEHNPLGAAPLIQPRKRGARACAARVRRASRAGDRRDSAAAFRQPHASDPAPLPPPRAARLRAPHYR